MTGQATCDHMISRSREGHQGSWCEACGVKVLEVHNRPCRECRHYRRIGPEGYGGHSICRKLLMSVTPQMHVCYFLVAGDGRTGLCFEDATTPENLQ